jgi:hypothetical protein
MSVLVLKTTEQLRAIFGLGRTKGLEKEDLEEMAAEVSNGRVERLSLLSFDEANAMIVRLGGDSFTSAKPVARRTENYRRQKAGIKRVESAKHLSMIDQLARLRNMSPEGLERLCQRMIKKPRPATTAEGNKIIEALKAMNRRDGIRTGSGSDRIPSKEAA